MMLAIKLGVPCHKIFFNGPYKDQDAVNSLLRKGGTVNVDSWDELQQIVTLVKHYTGVPLKIGIRCNFEVDDGILSRFGFDVGSSEFSDSITLIDRNPNLQLTGLHCHFATRNLDCWKNRTKGMISIIDKHFRSRLEDLSTISLGGGIYGRMPDELKQQFPSPIPEFEDYAAAAALPFSRYFDDFRCKHLPQLIIEPGTALVADSMKYVCQVNSIKQVRDRTVVSLTGSSYNINPNPNRKNLPISCFPEPTSETRMEISGAYLGGYTCIESDYLYKGFSGSLAVGDFIMFDDVGSYSVVMKPPFILPNVAVLEPLPDGQSWRTIKRSETFDDVFNTYFDGKAEL